MDTTTDHFTPLALRVRGNKHFNVQMLQFNQHSGYVCMDGGMSSYLSDVNPLTGGFRETFQIIFKKNYIKSGLNDSP